MYKPFRASMLTYQQSETLHGHDGGQTVSLPKIGESQISSASLKLLEFDGFNFAANFKNLQNEMPIFY